MKQPSTLSRSESICGLAGIHSADLSLAYSNNQNLTTWADYLTASNSTSTGFPKNRLIDTC